MARPIVTVVARRKAGRGRDARLTAPPTPATARAAMALREELAAAVGSLTVLGTPPDVPPPVRVGALAFYPAVGLALGALAAGVAAAVASIAPSAAGAAGVAILAAIEGARGPLGVAAAA